MQRASKHPPFCSLVLVGESVFAADIHAQINVYGYLPVGTPAGVGGQ